MFADREDHAVTPRQDPAEAVFDQISGNALAAVGGIDGQGAEQQRRRPAGHGDRPEPQRPDHLLGVAGGKAEGGIGGDTLAQAVRRAQRPVRSEGNIEQVLDSEPVAGHLDLNIDHYLYPNYTRLNGLGEARPSHRVA